MNPDLSFTADDDFLDPHTVADGTITLDDAQPDVELTPNFAQGPEIASEVLVPARSAPDTALLVEDTLLELLEHGERDRLLILTGEAPNLLGSLNAGELAEFTPDYVAAVAYNPAIKWYGKLSKLLRADQFSLVNGALNLAMPPAMYRKVLQPFLGDFREEFLDTSPLVAVVRNLSDAMAAHGVDASRKAVQQTQKRSAHKADASDLQIDQLDTNNLLPDDCGDAADAHLRASLGIDEDMFGESVDLVNTEDPKTTAKSRFAVTLSDLSNKAVLDHILGEDENPDPTQVENRLLDEGFEAARVNQITAMLTYRLANNRRNAHMRPTGNRGLGNVDFGFEI